MTMSDELRKRAEELWMDLWKTCRGSPSQGLAVALMVRFRAEGVQAGRPALPRGRAGGGNR